MDEFLEKLEEDQRRLRKFLRAKAERWKTMGEALAAPVVCQSGAIYIAGEPPLDGLTRVIATDYLEHLPIEPVDDFEEIGERLGDDDVLLAFLHDGKDKGTRRLLERARARDATVLVVGGLTARTKTTKRQATVLLTLPTTGIKTIVETCFLAARILARISRGVAVGTNSPAESVTSQPSRESARGSGRASGRQSRAASSGSEATSGSESRRAKRKGKPKKLKPSVLDLPTVREEDLGDDDARPPVPVTTSSPAEELDEPPVGLVSHEAPPSPSTRAAAIEPSDEGPTFGSAIVIGSDVVPVPPPTSDPYSLEEDFLADLEMPMPSSGSAGMSASGDDRMVSARYSIRDCTIRWGRGGYPDESSPGHGLLQLNRRLAVFLVNDDDTAAATLQVHDELWVRIEIPAFLEPIEVRGRIADLEGTAGNGGTKARLSFEGLDEADQRKLERAAENLRAPA